MEDNTVVIFHLNPCNGELVKVATVNVLGGPAPLALDPSRQRLYVGRRSANRISTYLRDQATGQLSAVNEIELKSDPCYLGTDCSGQYLFSAYYGAGRVAVHRIRSDGGLDRQANE
jgi:6-phosphogluconolactonase